MTVSVRYIVNDVDAAIPFYTDMLGFKVDMHAGPGFASLSRGELRLLLNRPGPYQLQAAINAVHSDARDAAGTDWPQILALYDQWMALAPNPVVALNRAVAVAQIQGAAQALRLVEELDLPNYHLLPAVRAELLRRLGRDAAAADAYRRAIELCGNGREQEFLRRCLQEVAHGCEN